jgi:uncharacterized protein (TIGR02996 family)
VTTESGFLQAILAEPDNDAHRLVYADWLDEQGQGDRAEYIRVEVRLAACSPADEEYPDLLERQREVLATTWQHSPPAPVLPPGVAFRGNWYDNGVHYPSVYQRGFPLFACDSLTEGEFTRDQALRLRDALPEVVRTTTLRGLKLMVWGSRFVADILDTPAAAHLSALSTFRLAGALASPITANLQWLEMTGFLEDDDKKALADADALPRLVRLHAILNCPVTTMRRLTRRDWFGRLRRFDGEFFGGGDAECLGAAALARLPDLQSLDTGYTTTFRNALLARGRLFPSLAALRLRGVRGEAAVALAGAVLLKVAVLHLDGGGLWNKDLIVLAGSALFANLRVLSLPFNKLSDKGVAALAESPGAATLRILDLGHNKFGDGGLAALARPGAFPNLTTLDLRSSEPPKASSGGVARFLGALELPLRRLNLEGWPVDDAGAKALAANPCFSRLRVLDLRGCRIGPAGGAALFASPHLRRLLSLNLAGNPISHAWEALLDPAVLPDLCEYWLPDGVDQGRKDRLAAARGRRFFG